MSTSPASSPIRRVVHHYNPKLLEAIDAVVFDCDGVLWRGANFIPGVVQTLKSLKAKGKKVIFCTNNSTKSRADYLTRFKSQGLDVDFGDIYSSSFTTASYIASLPETTFDARRQKLLVLGHTGLLDELRLKGLQCLDASQVVPPGTTIAEVSNAKLDQSIGGVVVGLDPNLTYCKVAYACAALREIPNCLFISTNQDKTFPGSRRKMPGAGSCVAMVSAGSGRTPINIGKPSRAMMETLLRDHKLDRSRVLMVGDRQDTDVAFANACSVRSLLVFTGVTHEHEFKDHHDLRTTSDPAKLLPFLMTPAALTTPQTVHSSGALLTPTTDEMLTPLFVAPSVNALAPEIEAKYSNAVAEMVAKPAPSNVILSKL